MQITFISSFLPRKCGIATYTHDLSFAIQQMQNQIDVVAMENPAITFSYAPPVIRTIRQEEVLDYTKTAKALNALPTDIVHLEHEFGLFGGKDGEYILMLAKELTKPFITTLHTILLAPSEHQKYIIQELARLSRKVIVMEEIAKDRLENVYGLDPKDIVVILHGAPTITIDKKTAKKIIGHPDAFILFANNLLSRNKGIEYAIEAVAKVGKAIPNLLFLVVGETHPLVKVEEGESYRNELLALVKKLHMEKQVLFINRYVSLEELKQYLAATDIYITPYLDPQQITSGTLSYALGAEKVCIATEYMYAKEMLSQEKGIVVPMGNSTAITTALIDLYIHPEKRHKIERRLHALSLQMSWPAVAQQHLLLYKHILFEDTDSAAAKEYIAAPLDISYLLHMTDNVGIMQHAYYAIPDRKFGYSTDDNARACIVAARLYKEAATPENTRLLTTYLGFLHYAQTPTGNVHTFMNFQHAWEDTEDIADAYGKTIWAFGFYLYLNRHSHFASPVHTLFITGMKNIDNIRDIRTAAYAILGLYYYILAYDRKTDPATEAILHIKKLATMLMDAYTKTHDATWNWFEEALTYDNFRLSQALFAAYMITKEETYKEVATSTLQFITNCNFDGKKKYFDFIGQNGWHKKGEKKAEYDQQPLEAAGAIETYLFAAKALGKKEYMEKARIAFAWFFGKNRNHRFLYDRVTRGVHDGLNLRGVNQNQGAESIVCFLMAALSLQEMAKKL